MGRSDIGTFKFHVREVVDAFGNKAVYSYVPADDTVDGSTRLISQIDYTEITSTFDQHDNVFKPG